MNNRVGEAYALITAGRALRKLGDLEGARKTQETALSIAREMGGQDCEAQALNDLGATLVELAHGGPRRTARLRRRAVLVRIAAGVVVDHTRWGVNDGEPIGSAGGGAVGHTGRTAPPEPGGAQTVDELAARLRALHSWAGVSYREIHRRLAASRRRRGIAEIPVYNTVYRCLQPGRSRLDAELVVDIAAALLQDEALVAAWRQAHQVVAGRAADAAIVSVTDSIPADQGTFTGRSAEVAGLLAACDAGTTQFVLGGMAGVGKTQLARYVANRLIEAGHGNELQLSVDLRGFDPDRPPADPAAVLDGFLRRLGVPGSQVHALDLAGRARRFRQLMADRKAIVLLDNAATEDQVLPLLAQSPTCVTVVTSRYQLGGLPDVKCLALDVFTPAESLDLLRGIAGEEAIDADRQTAARIARLVGHLPLALAVVAGRITDSPGWCLGDHLERLTEHRERLRLEDSVEPALALSYEALPPERRRLLRLLALHPGRDLDSYAAAAVSGQRREQVVRVLADLVRASLLQPAAAGRFVLHDLVRVFACDRSRDEDRATVRRDALSRLFDHYRWAAAQAAAGYAPHEGSVRALVEDPGTECPQLGSRDLARAWLDAERSNLIAVVRAAAELGSSRPVTDISTVIHYYLDTSGYYREAEVLHECAVAAATDDASRSRAHNNLGCVYWRLGRYADGRDCYQRALDLTRKTGNRIGTGKAVGNVALGHFRLGRYLDAIDCFEQALTIFHEENDERMSSASTVRGGLGWSLLRVGRTAEALERFDESLRIARLLGDSTFEEAYALANVGNAHARLGGRELATEYGEAALALSRKLAFRSGEVDALNLLGRVRLTGGEPRVAVRLQQEALDLTIDIGSRAMTVEIRNDLGASLMAADRLDQALEEHQLALVVAQTLEDRYEIARACHGLSEVLGRQGADGAAYRERAVALFVDLGTPEAAEIHATY
ncbi:tetratricopeptide repeat protein [Kribbella qitaiheensis]|uniref:tetratricopeptide repeat protein n=1 Tax=Kribbella qitaiheensis TaxID=1544730 RepID=UPI0016283123|nr:tetratricopeptide repeat protein [Kribbella qitaiheensis]